MAYYDRIEGREQPAWKLGPVTIRLPFVHYRLEWPELIQGVLLFIVILSMLPLLEEHLGLPYDVALVFVFVNIAGFLLPTLLGVPMVPGWITPALPLVIVFLGDYEPGPEAIQALFALQLLVFLLLFIFGITGLGEKLIKILPNSLKAGILIGAGFGAVLGEITEDGSVTDAPISVIAGSLVTLYVLFSVSFRSLAKKYRVARYITNLGLIIPTFIAIGIAWIATEYPLPDVEWGITAPNFAGAWEYTPFAVGLPTPDIFLLALPTALIAYVIAFGDMIVGSTLTKQADMERPDEKIDISITRLHLVTSLRNVIHAFFAPFPGLAGPVWTPVHAVVVERYRQGRRAMDSIHGGMGSFWIAGLAGFFILPIVTFTQPVQPLIYALALIMTGYVTIEVGIQQTETGLQRGVAGLIAIVLAIHGAGFGLAVGVILYFTLEFPWGRAAKKDHSDSSTDPSPVPRK